MTYHISLFYNCVTWPSLFYKGFTPPNSSPFFFFSFWYLNYPVSENIAECGNRQSVADYVAEICSNDKYDPKM